MVIQVVMVDDGGFRDSIKGEEDKPQDRTLRDATGQFGRIALPVVDRHFLEPVIQKGQTRQGQYCGFQMCTLCG